jgi:hypothetical protein
MSFVYYLYLKAVSSQLKNTKCPYSGPPGWGLGVRLTTPPRKKKIVLLNLKEMKLDGYLGDVMN